jgi:hypothetical protein
MTCLRIVSGGQTGVDRAALDAAMVAGIDCGGWCPPGRRAEDGRIADDYPLRETASANYVARTRANVRDSDATLIIVRGTGDVYGGTRLTILEAEKLGRPLLLVSLAETDLDDAAARIAAWIGKKDIATLNIAGPRESESPGIYAAARGLVSAVIQVITR